MAKRRRKRRISIKKVSIFLSICLSLFLILFNLNNIRCFVISILSGYKFETVSVFIENNIYDEVKDYEYSKTLEMILDTEYYSDNYINEYINISYIDKEDYFKNISILLNKGYKAKDINNIYDILDEESLSILLEKDYFKEIVNLISIEYFKEDKLERYIDYYNLVEYDIEKIITYVNIGLDNDYYTNVNNIDNQDNIMVLVNKYNKLSSDYIPNDLRDIKSKYGTGKMQSEAADAFESMCEAALKDGIKLYGGSGYRSYSYQENLYNRYVKQDGKQKADTYSARAGYSEHQTGLAIDIMNGKWGYIDSSDKEYTWLINNSYKYGYILRYLEDAEKITGYMYEPWHYRYVGVDVAAELTKLGITYDEYVAKK